MQVNEEQKTAIRNWLAEGASLSDVQKRLKEEFALSMTYMELRLLVLDIGAAVKDKPEPKKEEPPPQVPAPDANGQEVPQEEGEAPKEGDENAPAGNVSVTLDQIVVPGAICSGNATFSDGVTGRWMIDQQGRLGLDTSKPGYRPSREDLQAFQVQLRALIEQRGYY